MPAAHRHAHVRRSSPRRPRRQHADHPVTMPTSTTVDIGIGTGIENDCAVLIFSNRQQPGPEEASPRACGQRIRSAPKNSVIGTAPPESVPDTRPVRATPEADGRAMWPRGIGSVNSTRVPPFTQGPAPSSVPAPDFRRTVAARHTLPFRRRQICSGEVAAKRTRTPGSASARAMNWMVGDLRAGDVRGGVLRS
jgi:hypothetical protein